jgi:hypothetical protein
MVSDGIPHIGDVLIAIDCPALGMAGSPRTAVSWIIARLDVAAAAIVLRDGAGYTGVLQSKSYLLEEGLGYMESVDIVGLGHNRRRRLGVSFGHGVKGCARGRGEPLSARVCSHARASERRWSTMRASGGSRPALQTEYMPR